eukprot:358288-Chlamydomonas_euryale.AAC.9
MEYQKVMLAGIGQMVMADKRARGYASGCRSFRQLFSRQEHDAAPSAQTHASPPHPRRWGVNLGRMSRYLCRASE